jgi:hypothetical protein
MRLRGESIDALWQRIDNFAAQKKPNGGDLAPKGQGAVDAGRCLGPWGTPFVKEVAIRRGV